MNKSLVKSTIVPYSVEIKLTYHLLGNYDRSTDETVDGKAV